MFEDHADSEEMFEDSGDSEESVDVVVRFIIPRGKSEVTVSESLSFAFQVSQKYGLMIDWVREEKLLEMLSSGSLDESSVVVLDPFNGPCYSEIRRHCQAGQLTVLGPSCLVSCLQKNEAVPSSNLPVYSSAMRGLVVTSSGLEAEESSRYKEMVEAMSGLWSVSLHDGVTHLVTATVLSEKYRVAASLGLPVMAGSWLEEVWRGSGCPQVTAEDDMFRKHQVPPLLGVRLCVSGLGRQDRDMLRRGVEGAGGELTGALDRQTDVLVCVTAAGEKWRAAVRWGITCVRTAWLLDSLDSRRYLDTQNYRLDLTSEDSEDSRRYLDTQNYRLDLTSQQTGGQPRSKAEQEKERLCPNSSSSSSSKLQSKSQKILAELELSDVKKAGTFLDGCTVFLAVSAREEETKLTKVLKFAGAVRLSQLTERVTHIVQDSLQDSSSIISQLEELDISPDIVDVGWIVESMKAGRPVATVASDNTQGEPVVQSVVKSVVQADQQECSYETVNTFTSSVDTSNFEDSILAYYR